MKQIIVSLVLACIVTSVFAQKENEEKQKGFKKENLFAGGSITASFYSGGTILGANPFFGYKLANPIDVGVAFNYTYMSARDYIDFNDKYNQNVLGPGVFTRIYPLRFLFLEGQFEHNFTNIKYTDGQGVQYPTTHEDANSFLVGGGIAEGRRPGSNTFFYISLLFDVLKNPNSPYVQNVYEGNVLVRTDMIPILRAGINIALFQGKNKHTENNNNNNYDRNNGHRQPRYYND